MRKKSHILLARYLADQMLIDESLQSHRKAFCLGSVLPDIKPSFITQRHEFFGTFDDIKVKIRELVEYTPDQFNERVYWRHFGEVMHYMADYFTFPHNLTYTGNFFQHNKYEKLLKNNLKSCILSGKAGSHLRTPMEFRSLPQLTDYIKTSHSHYLKKKRNVSEDIDFILDVCYQVVHGIIQLCTRWQTAHMCAAAA